MSEIDKYKDKDNFMSTFESLRPDLYYPESWSDEDKAVVAEMVRPQKTKTTMFASIPMRCEGQRCRVADSCPLLKVNKAPVGMPCPIEMSMVQQFMFDYMAEMHVDPDNLVEVSIIRDIVDQEVQYLRKTKVLAKEDFIQENPVGVDGDGNVILKKELHQAVEYEDRILKRKSALLKQMTATRAEKAKIGQGNIDTAQSLAQTFSKLAELQTAQEKLIRTKLGIQDRDEYIDAVEAEVIEPDEEE